VLWKKANPGQKIATVEMNPGEKTGLDRKDHKMVCDQKKKFSKNLGGGKGNKVVASRLRKKKKGPGKSSVKVKTEKAKRGGTIRERVWVFLRETLRRRVGLGQP